MSETIAPDAATAQVAPDPAPAPAPAPEPAPAPAPAPEPAPAPAAPEQAPAEPVAPEPAPSLLSEIKPPEQPEPAPPEKPVEPPKPEPRAYEPFTLPEHVTAEPEQMSAYTALLGEHNLPQDVGQKLIDLHVGAMAKYADHTAAEQRRVWNETLNTWRTESLADEQVGGAGHQTAMQAIARVRDLALRDFKPEERQAFNQVLDFTGLGSNRWMLRAFHNLARYLDEPRVPPAAAQPPPDIGKGPRERGLRSLYNSDAMQRLRDGG